MVDCIRCLAVGAALGVLLGACTPVTPVPVLDEHPSPVVPTATTEQPRVASVPAVVTPTPWSAVGAALLVVAGEQTLRPGASPVAITPAGDPPGLYAAVAAPDGSALAYAAMQEGAVRLWLHELSSGTTTLLPAPVGDAVARAAFAPDGAALAYTLIGQERWQLLIYDRAAAAARVLAQGSMQAGAETLPLPLVPIAWTPRGLLVEQILYATDALPRGLTLLDPVTGETQMLRAGEHLQAISSSDGAQVALVVGQLPPGGQPTAALLRYEVATGAEHELLPQQQAMLPALAWSPDGTRLAYAAAPGYQSPEYVLGVIDADGANLRTLDLVQAAAGYRFLDLAWADPATLLVLVGASTTEIELWHIPLEHLETGAFSSVARWSLSAAPPQSPRIVHVPR